MSIHLENCRCGGPVSLSARNDRDGAVARCVDCCHAVTGHSLEDTCEKWNKWATTEDTWESLFNELRNKWCDGWCNGYEECGTTDCRMYGIIARAKRLEEKS